MTSRTWITRRTLLAGSLAAGATPLLARLAAAEEDECKATVTAIKARPDRAVSLRQISLALAAGKPVRLEGMTRLDGYVIDDDNKDIALFGPGRAERRRLRGGAAIGVPARLRSLGRHRLRQAGRHLHRHRP